MNSKEAYLAIVNKRKEEKIEQGEVLTLEMPSGAVWKYLPVNTQAYAISGRLPMHLVAKLESVKNAPQRTLTQEEILDLGMSAMFVAREVMLNNLVEPRITLEETPDSISPEQIDPEDFEFFMNFIVRGSQADANLKSQPAVKGRKRAA